MKTFTNNMLGPRGINLKGGATAWIEPGQSVEIDPKEIVGEVPDLGKTRDSDGGGDSAILFEVTAENAALKTQVSDLTKKVETLTAENAALKEPKAEPGPLDGSVDDLTTYLTTVTDADEVQKLLDAETAGKSRKGAVAALEARRDELLA